LILDFEKSGFNFNSLLDNIMETLSPKNKRVVEFLLFGLKEENLNNHFYRVSSASSNKFIREYFKTDLLIRNIQSAYIARKNSMDPDQFIIGRGEIQENLKSSKAPDFGLTQISDTSATVIKILETENILDREQQIDMIRWKLADEICTFNYFDINIILLFILKASIVERWSRLDKKRGLEIFEKFVYEVKGSFKLDNNN